MQRLTLNLLLNKLLPRQTFKLLRIRSNKSKKRLLRSMLPRKQETKRKVIGERILLTSSGLPTCHPIILKDMPKSTLKLTLLVTTRRTTRRTTRKMKRRMKRSNNLNLNHKVLQPRRMKKKLKRNL